jgi:hypothetical protein
MITYTSNFPENFMEDEATEQPKKMSIAHIGKVVCPNKSLKN